MSLCLACALTAGPSGTQKLATSKAALSQLSRRVLRKFYVVSRRRTSTRSASTSSTSTSDPIPKALTALHKTRSFASDVLTSRHKTELWDSWNKLLEQAHDDLTALRSEPQETKKARVLIYGCDKHSGSRDMVTALLELHIEPTWIEGSDEGSPPELIQNNIIRTRWNRGPVTPEHTTVVIERAPERDSRGEGPSIHFEDAPRTIVCGVRISPFLDQFETSLKLTEIEPCPAGDAESSRTVSEAWKHIYSADVPVIMCSPLTTPLTTFVRRELPVPLSRNAIIIFVSPSMSEEARAQVVSCISQAQHERLNPGAFSTIAEAESERFRRLQSRVLFVDPSRALRAVRTLQDNPKASEKYQEDFVGSNVSAFTEALKEIVEPFSSPNTGKSDTAIATLRVQAAQTVAEGALHACRIALHFEEQEIASLEAELASLKKQVDHVKEELPRQVLGLKSESGGEVMQALKEAEEALREVMGKLTWWKATWRVDEVGQIVASAVERNWCKRLEDRLIFHAGRLTALQGELKTATDSLLSNHTHPSPFDTPVLQNTLAQLSSTPWYPINPHVLTSPLTSRLGQITQYPTTRLHLSAQRMVLGLSGSAVSGVGLGVAGWAGYLNIWPLGWVLGYGSMEPMTAVGVGALVGVAGLRWAVGRWERAKKAWWKDWGRVGEGLDRDLRAHLDRTIREQVVVAPERAYKELEGMAENRKANLEKSLDELQDLQDELRSLHSTHTKSA